MLLMKLLLTIFTGTESIPGAIVSVLFMAGLWRMFEKSGLKGWWALIPGAREYQLARCAGRESEGPVYSLTAFATVVLNAIALFIPSSDKTVSTASIVLLVSAFTKYAYDAMKLRVDGYVMKPAQADRIREEIGVIVSRNASQNLA